jgi:GTP-binding protein
VIVFSADFVKSATEPAGYPPPGPPEFAFCGRSNVGKSSALNALAGRRQLARVSRTPGRTRLINFFDLRVAEKTRSGTRGAEQTVRFADLPGYGFASGPRGEREQWKKMIETYLTQRDALKALVVLVDGDLGPQPSDSEMVAWGVALHRKVILVATKLDKLSRSRRSGQVDKISARLQVPQIIPFSAKEGFGVEELWHALLSS